MEKHGHATVRMPFHNPQNVAMAPSQVEQNRREDTPALTEDRIVTRR